MWPATGSASAKATSPTSLRLAVGGRDAVDADIDHRRARLDPVAAHELGLPTATTRMSACAAERRQVAGARMGDGHRAIGAQQQLRHRAADQGRAADHDGVLAGQRAAARRCSSIEQPSGVQGTGKSSGAPGAIEPSRPTLIGWKPSTSLSGSMASSTCAVSMCLGSGSCTRMPWTRIGVERGDQRQQLGLGRVVRQAMIEARHAELGRELALAADIDLARRILADQHHGQAGLGPAAGDQRGDARADALAQAGAYALPSISFASAITPRRVRSIARYGRRSSAGSPAMLDDLVAGRGAACHRQKPTSAAARSRPAARSRRRSPCRPRRVPSPRP